MNPECPKCESTSVRRRPRAKSLTHRLMYLFGLFPWECLTCQKHYFSSKRHSRSRRHSQGEIYTGAEQATGIQPGAEEGHSQ